MGGGVHMRSKACGCTCFLRKLCGEGSKDWESLPLSPNHPPPSLQHVKCNSAPSPLRKLNGEGSEDWESLLPLSPNRPLPSLRHASCTHPLPCRSIPYSPPLGHVCVGL
jgi:hypothetical protein